jgi:hypothetical protein
MKFHLYKVSGYEEAIMSVRMSQGKYFSPEKAQEVQDLVYVMTNKKGFLSTRDEHFDKCKILGVYTKDDDYSKSNHPKITTHYDIDREEFKRLLGITFNNAMKEFDHHTLMKYIDISFFTEGLHRGGQDDLDAHAPGFNNRITRFSTRLAEIPEPKLSEWYTDKVITFYEAEKHILSQMEPGSRLFPQEIEVGGEIYKYTPFGYMHEKYASIPHTNGLYKDVQRGLIPIGQAGPALWKTDLWNLRYIYFRRSKLTKANPELKLGMEQLADQIEASIPVFGPFFRLEYTDSGQWEHMNKVHTVSAEEFRQFMAWKGGESK